MKILLKRILSIAIPGLMLFSGLSVVSAGGGGLVLEECTGFGAGIIDNPNCNFVGVGDGQIDVAPGSEDGLPGAGTSLITTVNNVINYALGLLALITLVILIFGGFTMLFSFNDDAGYKKGFTILKNAAIALVFIGLSWILVRFIFFVIDFIA